MEKTRKFAVGVPLVWLVAWTTGSNTAYRCQPAADRCQTDTSRTAEKGVARAANERIAPLSPLPIIFHTELSARNSVSRVDPEVGGEIAAMSTAILAAIAVILCILFRILNVNSQPQIPNIWCGDEGFLEIVLKISPLVREP